LSLRNNERFSFFTKSSRASGTSGKVMMNNRWRNY
jgi:hypothetical protein